jgi:hypothetical protein
MNDDQKAFVTAFFLLFFVVGLLLGYLMTEQVYQKHALKAGVGYYDGQTGTFKYKIMDEDSAK